MDQDQGHTGQTPHEKTTQSGKKPITDAHREKIRRFFLPYLFPVSGKSLCVPGHSWKFEAKKHIASPFLYDGKNKPPPNPSKDNTKKLLIRSAPGYEGREGLDMGHARLVAVDLDEHKKDFQNPHAVLIKKRVFETTGILQSTLRNGWHGIYRQPPNLEDIIRNSKPCPGVEVQADGGALIAWALAEAFGAEIIEKVDTAAELWEHIPYFDPRIIAPPHNTSLLNTPKNPTLREFGAGKNNAAVPQRAGKAAFSPQAFKEGARAFIELIQNNAGRKDFDALKHGEDFLRKFTQSLGLKIQKQGGKQPEIVGGEDTMLRDKKDIKTGIQKWMDTEKLFPFGAVTVISGRKGSGKTKAVLGYLLSHKNIKFGYFSDSENFEDRLKRQLMAHGDGALERGMYFDLSSFRDAKNLLKQVEFEIKKHSLNAFYLDPPHTDITGKMNDELMAGGLIGGSNIIAKRTRAGILIARNMAKTEYKEVENRIAGSFIWYTKPQSAVLAQTIEAGSKLRKLDDKPKTLLYQIATNVGELAPRKPVCEGRLVEIVTDEGKDHEWILDYDGAQPISGIKVDPWIKSTADRAKSRKEEILEWFSTQPGQKALCREAKKALAPILGVKEKTIKNIVAKIDEISTETDKDKGRAGENKWFLTPPTNN